MFHSDVPFQCFHSDVSIPMVPILIPFLRLRSDVILHVLSATSLPFSVEWLILDEADKLFEDGKLGFRDQVRDLLRSTKAIYRRHA